MSKLKCVLYGLIISPLTARSPHDIQMETQQCCNWFMLWDYWQTIHWFLLHAKLCINCCVTCCCQSHACELQGVVIGVFDSPLSHKECFQSLPTSTGTKNVSNFHSELSKGTLVLGWEKNVPYPDSCSYKRRFTVCLSPNSNSWAFCLTSKVRKLRWHLCDSLLPFFSQLPKLGGAMRTEVVKVVIRQGEGSSGVQSVSLEVRQKGKKTRGRQNQSQTAWNAAKPWNEQFLSPPSPKCHISPSLSTSLSLMLHFFFTHTHHFFLPNPSISQSALHTLHFYFPSHLSFRSSLFTSHCSCESVPAHNISVLRVNILILDHFRPALRHSLSPSLPFSLSLPLSLSGHTLFF